MSFSSKADKFSSNFEGSPSCLFELHGTLLVVEGQSLTQPLVIFSPCRISKAPLCCFKTGQLLFSCREAHHGRKKDSSRNRFCQLRLQESAPCIDSRCVEPCRQQVSWLDVNGNVRWLEMELSQSIDAIIIREMSQVVPNVCNEAVAGKVQGTIWQH
jgi:hypothetical protein